MNLGGLNRVGGIVLAMLLLSGCAHWPAVDSSMKSPTQEYHIPPKEIYATVKQVVTSPPLSLPITEEKDGSMLTGFQPFPGEWHVARRWQEQTRYRITVVPDWNDPIAAGRVEVREMTEQRAADGMKWAPAPELQRPERAEALLKSIDAQIHAKAGK